MSTVNEVLEFISRRFANLVWTDNDYWFAKLLCTRFHDLKLYYLPEHEIFVASDGYHYYSWEGMLEEIHGEILDFDELLYSDPTRYRQLLVDKRN